MQHFANFGYVKQANKQLKRLNDIRNSQGAVGELSSKFLEADYPYQTIESGIKNLRERKANIQKFMPDRVVSPVVGGKPNPAYIVDDFDSPKYTLVNRKNIKTLTENLPSTKNDKQYFKGLLEKNLRYDTTGGRRLQVADSEHSKNVFNSTPEIIPENPTSPHWSGIRKTKDTAASPTGYLGFRTNPYEGYGGMMEESIPIKDLSVARRIN